MRFATFVAGGDHHLGVVDGEEIADVTAVDGGLGPDLGAVLAAGRLAEVATVVPRAPRIPLQGATLVAAGAAPSEGARHRLELRHARGRDRRGAAAAPALVQQAVDVHHRPGRRRSRCPASSVVDYEGELAFVIGRAAGTSGRAGCQVIAGYTIVNDVTVRDWQMRTRR